MANPFIPSKPKSLKFSKISKSAGILDDHAVRKNLATKEGTIEKVPVNDSDIVNKKYVDEKEVEDFPTSLTAGSVVFSDGSNLTEDNSNLFWDDTNNRLGIGTDSPLTQLHLETDDGDIKLGTGVFTNKSATTDTGIELSKSGQLKSGLFTEVNGVVLSYSINTSQIGDRNTSFPGGIFRFDTRSAGVFNILGIPVGGSGGGSSLFKISLANGLATFSDYTRTRALLGHTTWGGAFYSLNGVNEVDIASNNYGLIVKTGNVGINTTSPDTKLQVVGDCKFGDDNTNYASFGTDGELTLTGTARVNKEFRVELTDFNPGASGPTKALNDIFPTYEFTIGDDMHTSFEMPPDWASGTDIKVEVYWAVDEAYATNSGEVRWSADWRAVAVGEVISGGSSGTMDFGDVDIPATANTIVKTIQTISGASLSADDLVAFNCSRVALVGGNNPTAEPYIVDVRVEYISDKLGEAT